MLAANRDSLQVVANLVEENGEDLRHGGARGGMTRVGGVRHVDGMDPETHVK
jgi:hypothetical protein